MENVGAVLRFWIRGIQKCYSSATISLSFLTILFIGSFIYWADLTAIPGYLLHEAIFGTRNSEKSLDDQVIAINCTAYNLFKSCPPDYLLPPKTHEISGGKCPEYFRWIHSDLQPWKHTGISREMLEKGRDYAHFRLVIIKGKVYIEKYKKPYQTRDLFTVWGILQLLRLYPGKVPDLELMFWCDDRPVIIKSEYEEPNSTLPLPPPPVFHYCGHEGAFDIVFPDWTFWGWPETNIKPWTSTLEDIKKGNKRTIWEERIPDAYWKGNPNVSLTRKDLMKCNSTRDKYDWNSRLYAQDWDKEMEEGYKNSKLEDQCTHRYKIYVEGRSWSVSDKYILACDSMTLMIEPEYYDFYLRSMVPLQHYWPIRTTKKCRDIKFAVEWGNRHGRQARAIGRAGSKYVEEQLKMKYVYDYMFHLLNEYAKLLNFKPRIPKRTRKMCSQKLLCLQSQHGLWKKFMVESMVNSSSETLACSMPPPFEPLALEVFFESKEMIKKQVEMWETEFWENLNQDQ